MKEADKSALLLLGLLGAIGSIIEKFDEEVNTDEPISCREDFKIVRAVFSGSGSAEDGAAAMERIGNYLDAS